MVRDTFSQEIRIFREAAEMFPGTIQGMLINRRNVDLQLLSEAGSFPPQQRSLLIFDFQIVRSNSPFSRRTLASPSMLVFDRAEISARFLDKFNRKSLLYDCRLRPEITPDGKIRAGIEFSLSPARKEPGPLSEEFQLNTVAVLAADSPCELARFKSGGREYLIYLTAHLATEVSFDSHPGTGVI